MKNHLFKIFALALIAFMATSCGNKITVQGYIFGVGNQNLHMVWVNESGTHDAYGVSNQDRFEVKGEAESTSLVLIYDGQNRLIAHFIMDSGEKMQIKGDINDPYKLQVKGSDINEDWYKFINDNASSYQTYDKTKLDAAIEKYVNENPDELLSTVLVLMDYSQLNNEAKMKELLGKIDEDAKPAWLLKSYETLRLDRKKPIGKITSLLLLNSKGDFSSFSPSEGKASLIYFWSNTQERQNENEVMHQLSVDYNKKLQIADIFMDPDTSSWHGTLLSKENQWTHFWAPEGPANMQLKDLQIDGTPLFIVTDSLGSVKYRGPQVTDADAKVRQLLQ